MPFSVLTKKLANISLKITPSPPPPPPRILADCKKRFTSMCQASEVRPSVAFVTRLDTFLHSCQIISTVHAGLSSALTFDQPVGEGVVEVHELEATTSYDHTRHKFEMLGAGCVRSGSTKEVQKKKLEKDAREGILRSENILKLGFGRSRMVVLSACNTAKGVVSNSGINLFQMSYSCPVIIQMQRSCQLPTK